MAIELNDNVNILAPKAPDERMYVADSTARDAIDSNYRWPGMLVYLDDTKEWQYLDLQDGDDLSSNASWVALGGGGSDFIPLSGTTVGNPVTGNIELAMGTYIGGVSVGEPTIYITKFANENFIRIGDAYDGGSNKGVITINDNQNLIGLYSKAGPYLEIWGTNRFSINTNSTISGNRIDLDTSGLTNSRNFFFGDFDHDFRNPSNGEVLTFAGGIAQWQAPSSGGGTLDWQDVIDQDRTVTGTNPRLADNTYLEFGVNGSNIGYDQSGTNRLQFNSSGVQMEINAAGAMYLNSANIIANAANFIQASPVGGSNKGFSLLGDNGELYARIRVNSGNGNFMYLNFPNAGALRNYQFPDFDLDFNNSPSDGHVFRYNSLAGEGRWEALPAGGFAQNLSDVLTEGNTAANDLELTGSANGIILESPDGTRWRIQVDNSGNLTTTSL